MSSTNNLVGRSLSRAVLALAISAVLPATNAVAQSSESMSAFDIPAGKLSDALDSFMSQSGAQVLYKSDLIAGKKSQALRGSMDRAAGLTQLLSGTGLVWEKANGSTFVIKQTKTPLQKPDGSQGKVGGATKNDAANEPTTMNALVVTGTRIRGGATPSPIITIGAERIQEEGFTDLGQVMRSVSQNYGGGQNPGVTAGAYAGGFYNQNTTGGSTANLRGIGQDATLTLLNGRRMSYGGYDQAVDISAIPVEAVDRIEIVTDGASAIYGSDAVGGVVNVMLKRDFDGVAVGARYGEATDGGMSTHEYNVTAGSTWSSGGLIATLKKATNGAIYADQRDYTQDMYDPSSLYQDAEVRSGLLSLHQSLGSSIELHLDALRTERDMQRMTGYAPYYFRFPTETTTSMISPSIVLSLPGDWSISASAALGKDKTDFITNQINKETGATTLTGFSYGNKSRMYEVGAEGPLLTLPGGDARLAVGGGYRYNDFLYLFNNGPTADGDEGSRFAYAELDVPLVSPGQNVKGVHRLGLTGAVRAEDYDSYGRVTTPKIGLIYSPTADFTLKASWGKSFKTPTLYQGYIGQFSYLYPATTFGGTAGTTALYLNGGNLSLTPERARTWSASIALHPEALPGLEAELTAFHIDYTDRIIQPITSTSDVLITSIYEDFIRYSPTAEEQAEVIASTQFANYTGSPYDASNLMSIIDNRFVNAAMQRIKGIDLSGSYRFDLATSRLTFRGSVSWLDSEQALTATSGLFDAAGNLFYPAKVSGRIGAVWNKSGFTASIFGNYKSGVTNTVDGIKGASYTTFDTTLRYDTGLDGGIFTDMSFEFSAQNLLNRSPPLYTLTDLSNAPYDSTNYSAIGRFLSVSMSKRW